jgi:hypothetical protein
MALMLLVCAAGCTTLGQPSPEERYRLAEQAERGQRDVVNGIRAGRLGTQRLATDFRSAADLMRALQAALPGESKQAHDRANSLRAGIETCRTANEHLNAMYTRADEYRQAAARVAKESEKRVADALIQADKLVRQRHDREEQTQKAAGDCDARYRSARFTHRQSESAFLALDSRIEQLPHPLLNSAETIATIRSSLSHVNAPTRAKGDAVLTSAEHAGGEIVRWTKERLQAPRWQEIKQSTVELPGDLSAMMLTFDAAVSAIARDDAAFLASQLLAVRVRKCGKDRGCVEREKAAEQFAPLVGSLDKEVDRRRGQTQRNLAALASAHEYAGKIATSVAELEQEAAVAPDRLATSNSLSDLVLALRDEEANAALELQRLSEEADKAFREAFGRDRPRTVDAPAPPTPAPAPRPGAPPPTAAAPPGIAEDHAFQFISTKEKEKPGFAAYTYVHLGHRGYDATTAEGKRYLGTLSDIVGANPAASTVPPARRHVTNLLCVPNKNAGGRNREGNLKPGDWLLTEYDYDVADQLLLTSHSGVVFRNLVSHGTPGRGPYLVTTLKPIRKTAPGDRLIFVDLSHVDPSYIPDLIAQYKQRFRQPPPLETATQWRPSFAARSIMKVAELADFWKKVSANLIGPLASKDSPKQAFIQVRN